jgi:hypothetical protein
MLNSGTIPKITNGSVSREETAGGEGGTVSAINEGISPQDSRAASSAVVVRKFDPEPPTPILARELLLSAHVAALSLFER